ncbi:MAG: hypothetical protein AMS20_04850 [Gemmatimonas sp. SG8_28]|nr:MAG: hypothetical protein AMS20_04850 [Gemmatimonas sp. SG8_28]
MHVRRDAAAAAARDATRRRARVMEPAVGPVCRRPAATRAAAGHDCAPRAGSAIRRSPHAAHGDVGGCRDR